MCLEVRCRLTAAQVVVDRPRQTRELEGVCVCYVVQRLEDDV